MKNFVVILEEQPASYNTIYPPPDKNMYYILNEEVINIKRCAGSIPERFLLTKKEGLEIIRKRIVRHNEYWIYKIYIQVI